MANKTAPHILSTSANLLGFCLFVIASFRYTDSSEKSIVDEFTAFVGLFLTVSCIFSFVSLRSQNGDKAKRLETIADYLFMAALVGILLIILLIALRVMH